MPTSLLFQVCVPPFILVGFKCILTRDDKDINTGGFSCTLHCLIVHMQYWSDSDVAAFIIRQTYDIDTK